MLSLRVLTAEVKAPLGHALGADVSETKLFKIKLEIYIYIFSNSRVE